MKTFSTQTPLLCKIFATGLIILCLADTRIQAQCSYFTRIVSGSSSVHALGIKSDGSLWAWGDNQFGELGDGTTNPSNSPEQIGAATNWVDLATGSGFSLGITADGKLWGWGNGGVGQLGNSTASSSLVPEEIVVPGASWAAVFACESHSIAITTDGRLWAWGYGILGNPSGNSSNVPIQIGTDMDWATVSTGEFHTLALKKNGTLWAWGIDGQGELGDGSPGGTTVFTPEQIGTANNWVKIAAGFGQSLGITADGKLWAWGGNDAGELGDGTTVDGTHGPEQIGTATNWIAISGGLAHSLGITADGKLWAWGENNLGELGDGTATDTLRPEQIGTATNWRAIVAAYETSFGLTGSGISWSWGGNDFGQLGNGTIISEAIPATIGVPVYTGLAAAGTSNTLYQQTLSNYATDCANLIATVAQSGPSPVSGITTAMLWIDGSVQVDGNNKPYLQRHYQITPAANATTSTATITLYFSQAEFTAYNADPAVAGGSYALLPADPADVQGYKANLSFTKISGVSSDGTGAPASYSGTATSITPTSVIYQNGWWAVTFSTVGFSGFFAGSGAGTLPLTWLAVTGKLDDQKHATIDWTVQEQNVAGYTVEKSVDGVSYGMAGIAAGKGDGLNSYQFTDATTLVGTAYYRIRQTDKDGKYSYSIVVTVNAAADLFSLSLYPNPGSDYLFINGLQANQTYYASVTDMSGHEILTKEIDGAQNEIFTTVLAKGIYLIKVTGNRTSTTLKFVKK
jgi:alpha-tubulin suppressor-like RCC1 family protein